MSIRTLGLWLTLAALGTFPTGAVLAADMPLKAAPIAPVLYDWSGVYVGVHAGYGGGTKDWPFAGDFVARGFLGGGQVGINKQLGSFVFGLELDGSWADLTGSQNTVFGGPAAVLISRTMTSKINGIATFAGRAGLAADRWFVFAKGGVAHVNEDHSFNGSTTIFAPPGFTSFTTSGNEHRVAPMVGFGAEYALGGNWSVKGEYNYIHLGSRDVRFTGTTLVGPAAADQQIEQAIHLVKLGVNYRFGGILTGQTFAPVPPAQGYNWSGAYIGAQGAYGFGHDELPNPISAKFNVDGWLAGATGGVNAQAGAFVFGVEGERMWTNIKGNQSITADFGGGLATATFDTKIDWLAIAAARAGFVVADRLLIYGKVGIAIAQEKHAVNLNQIIAPGTTNSATFNAKAIHTGVVGGVGAEYAVGSNWSVKIEYDYIKMLGQSYTGTGIEVTTTPLAVFQIDTFAQFNKQSQDLHLVKFGVNYHFSPTPIVVGARY